MAKNATLNIRIDSETKTAAEELFSSFGITISDAVIIFLRKSLMEGGLPFEMKQPRYNAETEAAMDEARKIMRGQSSTRQYASARELFEELDGDQGAEVC